jgi:hypothetical protein
LDARDPVKLLRSVFELCVEVDVAADIDGAIYEKTYSAFADIAGDALIVAAAVKEAVFDRTVDLESAESAPFLPAVIHARHPVE